MAQFVDRIAGRRRGNEQQWRARLRRFETSDSTVAEFCAGESVSIASFYHWRKRLQTGSGLGKSHSRGKSAAPGHAKLDQAGSGPGETLRTESNRGPFVPLRVTPTAEVEIHLPNGSRVCLAGGDTAVLRVAIEAAARATARVAEVASC